MDSAAYTHQKALPHLLILCAQGTVYGFAIGDFNEDGIPDIATARSGATSVLYFGKIKSKKIEKQMDK